MLNFNKSVVREIKIFNFYGAFITFMFLNLIAVQLSNSQADYYHLFVLSIHVGIC